MQELLISLHSSLIAMHNDWFFIKGNVWFFS